jgi:hypothetical protein
MLEIPTDDFTKLTEIVTRWELDTDASSTTEKSIRDRLLPLVASIRGFCVTPELADATAPAEIPEDWYTGDFTPSDLPEDVELEETISGTFDLDDITNADAP